MLCCTYCRTPLASVTTADENPAVSSRSLHCHTTSPVFLFSATIPPLDPGVQITLSPSTRGDSLYPQLPGGWVPPKSLIRFFAHTTFPSVRLRQARSPVAPRAYNTSPSTVGVERGPLPQVGFENRGPS